MGHSNQHEPDDGSGERKPEVPDGSRVRAERSAPALPAHEEPPAVRQPVSFSEVDPEEAIAILEPAVRIAATIIGGVDDYVFMQLSSQLVREIQSGAASDGVQVTSVCASSRTGRGRLPERYTPAWDLVASLSVRLITVLAGRRVLFEELYTEPADITRAHNGLGTHHNPQTHRAMHFAGNAIAAADRHSTTSATPLLIGTRDDRTAPAPEQSRIATFEAERGRPLPITLADHLREVLNNERQVREHVFSVGAELARILRPVGITPQEFAYRGFSSDRLLASMPYGPPTSRLQRSAGVQIPGKDRAVLALLAEMPGRAVVFAGTSAASAPLSAEELRRRGYQALRWEAGPDALVLGVPVMAPWGVQLLWSRDEQTLMRMEGGHGAWWVAWRLIGFREADLPTAAALAERSLQEWPRDCLARAYMACAPGRLKTRDLASQTAWRGLLRVADAALVDADRRMRARYEVG